MITMLSMGRHKPSAFNYSKLHREQRLQPSAPIPVYNIVYNPSRVLPDGQHLKRYEQLIPNYDIERTDPADADMIPQLVGSKPTHEQAEALVELLLAEDAQQRANDALQHSNTNTMENK